MSFDCIMESLREMHCSRPPGDKHAMHLIHADMCCACEIAALRQEVEILRQYGNKDCTAMADDRLAELRAGTTEDSSNANE